MVRMAMAALLVALVGSAGAQGVAGIKGKSAAKAPASSAAPLNPAALQAAAASLGAATGAKNKSGAVKASPALKSWAAGQSTSVKVVSLNGIQATIDPVRGPIMVEPDGTKGKSLAYAKSGVAPADLARQFVASQKSLFKLQDAGQELVLTDSQPDSFGMTHLSFDQYHAGIHVWGRELRAHMGPGGELKSLNGHVIPTPDATVPTKPAITADEADAIGEATLEAAGHAFTLSPEVAAKTGIVHVAPELHYWQADAKSPVELVYVVELRPNLVDWYRLFVNAMDGSVREQYLATAQDGPATAQARNQLDQTVTLKTYKIGSTYHLIDASRPMFVSGQSNDQLLNGPKGAIVTWDLQNHDLTREASIFSVTSSNNTWNDKGSVSAHDFGGIAYEYFRTKHNRNSIDGKGGTIISLIHVTDKGKGLDNAFWNGAAMIYGDGNTAFLPLSRGLDVATHEMSHGVIQNTADLEYKNQSGALNESFADVFGVLVDSDDYRVGEDVVKTSVFTSGALRSIQDPHNGVNSNQNGWQPATMAEFQNLGPTQDNGGVHINSGITNFAAYKVMNALGRDKTGQIYYRALSNYLGKQSNFLDARLALERSAKDLFGDGSAEVNAVSQAFTQVGIVTSGGSGGGTPTEPPTDAPTNTGAQQVVVVGGDARLYLTTPEFLQFPLLSNRLANIASGKMMAIDPTGEELLFVDSQKNLVSITNTERVISEASAGPWSSVAISPSGRFVSITRDVAENLIILLDLKNGTSAIVPLYRPTTGQGQLQDVVVYADAMTWLDDVYLAYDNLNRIDTPNGTREFWDISIMDTSRAFESTPVVNYYPLLSPVEGITIANPTVSTRNSSVLAFDLLDEATGAVTIMGVDLYSGTAKTIFNNGGPFNIGGQNYINLGYPDYTPDDRKLLFTSIDSEGNAVVATIPIADDGITPNGNPTAVSYGIRGLWFAVGQQLPQRDILLKVLTEKNASSGSVDVNRDGVFDAGDVGVPQ